MDTDINILEGQIQFQQNTQKPYYNLDSQYGVIEATTQLRVSNADDILDKIQVAKENGMQSNLIFHTTSNILKVPILWAKRFEFDEINEAVLLCVAYNLMSIVE